MTHIKGIYNNYQYLFGFYLIAQASHNTPSEWKRGHLLITGRYMYFLRFLGFCLFVLKLE